MSFIKNVEDFVCLNCDYNVKGNGYTNHCPCCLWSLHVDNNPGDRKNNCLGKMEPIDFLFRKGTVLAIIHKCMVCGIEKKNKISDKDSLSEVINKIKLISEQKSKGLKK